MKKNNILTIMFILFFVAIIYVYFTVDKDSSYSGSKDYLSHHGWVEINTDTSFVFINNDDVLTPMELKCLQRLSDIYVIRVK